LSGGLSAVGSQAAITSAIAAWHADDSKAKAAIGLSVADSQQVHILTCATAAVMWSQLCSVYDVSDPASNAIRRSKFLGMKQNKEESVATWCGRVETEYSFCKVLGCALAADDNVTVLLEGSDSSFDNTRQALYTTSAITGNTLTFAQVRTAFLAAESSKENADGVQQATAFMSQHGGRHGGKGGNGGNKDNKGRKERLKELKARTSCNKCGKKGHWGGDPECEQNGGDSSEEDKKPSHSKPKSDAHRASGEDEAHAHGAHHGEHIFYGDVMFTAFESWSPTPSTPFTPITPAVPGPLEAARAESQKAKISWAPILLDSGASQHMFIDPAAFESIGPLKPLIVKTAQQGASMKFEQGGTVRFSSKVGNELVNVTLSNAYYVPNSSANLVSVGQLQEAGGTIQFNAAKDMLVLKDGRVCIQAVCKDRVWRIGSVVFKQGASASVNASAMLGRAIPARGTSSTVVSATLASTA
jgi:hypothetical protein